MLAASRDSDAAFSDLTKFGRGDESSSRLSKVTNCHQPFQGRTYRQLLGSFLDLLDLDFREAFDLQEPSCSGREESLY